MTITENMQLLGVKLLSKEPELEQQLSEIEKDIFLKSGSLKTLPENENATYNAWIQPCYKAPGDLRVIIVKIQFLTLGEWTQSWLWCSQIAAKNKILSNSFF